MPEGTIKKVIAEKGFGFIATGRDDLFFHHSELRGVQIEQLAEGQAVTVIDVRLADDAGRV